MLDAIARNLEVSAETLYTHRARGLTEGEDQPPVVEAINAEPQLTVRQRQALIEIYDSFTGRRQTHGGRGA